MKRYAIAAAALLLGTSALAWAPDKTVEGKPLAAEKSDVKMADAQLKKADMDVVADAKPAWQPVYAEHIGGPVHLFGDFVMRHALGLQRERYVAKDAQVRVKRIALKNHGHVAGARRQVRHVLPIDQNIARSRQFQPRNHAQQGGFAGARGTQQNQELGFVYRKIDAVHGIAAVKTFRQRPGFDCCHFF